MKTKLLLAGIILIGLSANGQFVQNYMKAADEYFKKADYFSAAQYYEKVLGADPSKGDRFNPYKVEPLTQKEKEFVASRKDVVYKLAESYRLYNNYQKAEPFYKEATLSNADFPLARYYYAKSLRFNSKFEEAEAEFTKFLEESPSPGSHIDDAKKEIANLKFIQKELKKDTSLYTISKISADAFTNGADYAPVLMDKSTLVFTSTRNEDKAGKSNPHINHLYKGEATNNATFSATKMNVPQPGDVHQGIASFSPDGAGMYLTRWSIVNGKKIAHIYFSVKKNDGWSEPALLTGDVNADGYSSQQPFLAPDGKTLYYASEKPGGIGKFDIWMAMVDGKGSASNSTNLGETINTKDDEQAPYFFAGANTLIFSSNGRVGMGGFDFFHSKKSGNTWSMPVNMGYPVNSVKDDMYMVSTADKYVLDNVFLSSDRFSPCCYEMFTLAKMRPKKLITGVVVDCNTGGPISGARVVISDNNDNVVSDKSTGMLGNYELILEEFQQLKLTAQAEGYQRGQVYEFYMPKDEESNKLVNATYCLTPVPIPVEKPIVLNDIYYEYDKYKLLPSSYPVLDTMAALLERYPDMVIEISAHTDSKGTDEYNMNLSELRAKSVVDYLLSKGIDSSRLESKGYGETMPVAPNTLPNGKDNPEGRAKNRRVEFKVLRYK